MVGCLNKGYDIQLQPLRFFQAYKRYQHANCADSKYDFKGFLRIFYCDFKNSKYVTRYLHIMKLSRNNNNAKIPSA